MHKTEFLSGDKDFPGNQGLINRGTDATDAEVLEEPDKQGEYDSSSDSVTYDRWADDGGNNLD